MPHPSASNAYPSHSGFYPSAPSPPATWVVSADGTVTANITAYSPFGTGPFGTTPFGGGSGGPTLALVLAGGAAVGTDTSGGSADADYIGVVVAVAEVTSSASTLIVTHFATAAGQVASSGTASAVISATAEGTVTSSAVAPAAAYGDPYAWDTSSGTATANRTFADVTATGAGVSSASADAALIAKAVAAGSVASFVYIAGAELDARASAAGVVTSHGSADGVRVQYASADGEVASAATDGPLVRLAAAAAGTVASSATVTHTAQMWVVATVELASHADTDTTRYAQVTTASSGTAVANRGQLAVAVATVTSSGHAAGGRMVPAEVAVTTSSFAAAGGVIAWQRSATGTVTSTGTATARQFHPVLAVPPGPVKPQVAIPRQRLLVVDTVTGRLAAELPHNTLQWATPLNGETSCNASLVVEAALEAVFEQGARNPRDALSDILTGPFRFSLVVAHGDVAVQGGPLLPTDDESDSLVVVAGAGMERMLDRRLLIRRLPENDADPLAYATHDVILANTNDAHAIVALTAEAMATYRVPRSLPIYCSNPPDPTGTQTFNYWAYDEKTAWAGIGEHTGRVDGPDMRLEPHLAEDDVGVYVWWDVQVGNPTFDVPPGNYGPGGPLPWTWDDTIARVARSIDSAGMATDTISAGNGSERGRLMCESVDDTMIEWGFPPLEVADNGATAIQTLDLLQKRADAYEAAHRLPTDTWTVSAPIDGEPPLGLYRRGDIAKLEIRNKLLIPSGDYLRRITNVAYNTTDPATVAVTCAYEDRLAAALVPGPGVTY